jgi:8-oxo-dGTP diphosphatase
MKSYTVGLIFNSALDKVLLMEKNRPAWQKGKLNGIGGRIEEGEQPVECMVREAKEEANISSTADEWRHFATLQGPSWQVYMFALQYLDKETDAQAMTDEQIAWHNPKALPEHVVMNISWLVPLALEKLHDDQFDIVPITYKRDY